MAVSRSPDQLLKDLLAHNYEGSPLAAPVFISLYRSVWKPSKLLEAVINTYNDTLSLKATREACINILVNWIEARLIPDFCRPRRSKNKKTKGRTLLRLIEFADTLERRSHVVREFSSCYTLKLALLRTWAQRRRSGFVQLGPQQRLEIAVENNENKPAAEKTAADKEAKRAFLVYVWVPDPRNVAMRFTITELNMFRRIAHREVLGLTWKDRAAPHPAYNILELISRSNNVSFWVASRIVKRKTVEKRVDMIAKFIDIAFACAELHNYNTLMEILGGLNSHPISRLKKTWEKVPSASRETLRTLETLMESKGNYRTYRGKLQDLRTAGQFFLPHLGVYLRDMVSLNEAMPTKRDHGINMEKFNVILSVLAEVDYVVRQEVRAAIKRASAVMRGLQDDVEAADDALAYIARVQGYSEGELLRLSRVAEPPRVAPDSDLVRDESMGSFSTTSSHDDSSLHAVDSGPIGISKVGSSVALPLSPGGSSRESKDSKQPQASPSRGLRASGLQPTRSSPVGKLPTDNSSRSSAAGSDRST